MNANPTFFSAPGTCTQCDYIYIYIYTFMCTHLNRNAFKTVVNDEWMCIQDLISYITLFPSQSHSHIIELRSFISLLRLAPQCYALPLVMGTHTMKGIDTHSGKGGSFVHNRDKEVH